MTLMEISDLNVWYRSGLKPVWALRSVSLSLKEETAYGIVGESGSGKSTLARAILRLLPESTEVRGQIIYEGKDLLKLNDHEMRKYRWKQLAIVFQGSMNSLSPVHRIGEQLMDIYRTHDTRKTRQELKREILTLFRKLNLTDGSFKSYPHELSGGMMQRVNIAMSMLLNPKVLILDEATTALDVITERQILEEIKVMEKEYPVLRLTITHDVSVVNTSCQEVIVMYGGYVVEQGKVADVFEKPRHPYTRGLLDAYPDLDSTDREFKGIPGSIPDPSSTLEGCVFRERCFQAREDCRRMPLLKGVDGRKVACHYPLGGRHE